MSRTRGIKIVFNSPIVLVFTAICFLALLLNQMTGGWANIVFFSIYRASFFDFLTYIRFIGHVFGHSGWEHFFANIMLFLVIGPLLEEKYGSANLARVILLTAIITGLVHFIFFPGVQLLGASGVVFAFILLSSFTGIKDGNIPLTLILVSILYLGGQVYSVLFIRDNISNLTHILGGATGAVLGFVMQKNKVNGNK